jgi:hypothetical protein
MGNLLGNILESVKVSESYRQQLRKAEESQGALIHQQKIGHPGRLGGDFRLFTAIYTTKPQAGSNHFCYLIASSFLFS